MAEASRIAVQADPLAVLSFIFYLAIILAIGILSAKFSSSGLSEFFLAGRKLKEFVVALSAVVSGRSAWLLIGVMGSDRLHYRRSLPLRLYRQAPQAVYLDDGQPDSPRFLRVPL